MPLRVHRKENANLISEIERRARRLIRRATAGDAQVAGLADYSIDGRLGRGGMGEVYRARRSGDEESIALKVMVPEFAVDGHSRNGFLREIANIRSLEHPNIVRYREAGASDETLFLVMEYCAGGSVDALMLKRPGGVLEAEEAVSIALQSLEGLAYAHEAKLVDVRLADGRTTEARGLVHRDIKPQNILLDSAANPVAKVADFGLAKAFETAGLSGHTRTGIAVGTVQFMPRRQVLDYKYAGPSVDVWAMAASLYFMLTGEFPRDFGGDVDPYMVVLHRPPVSIHKRGVAVPKRLGDVVDAALVETPECAIRSARDLISELRSI
jgi:serine/threonine protein kinase